MTAVLTKKPAKAKLAAPALMTLAQATAAARAEVSSALELISSARSAAIAGDYLDRTLRVAEEMATDVVGLIDRGQHDRYEWSDRMFDCQALLTCVEACNDGAASTLAAKQAAKRLDQATEVLDHPHLGRAAQAAAVVSVEPAIAPTPVKNNPAEALEEAIWVLQSAEADAGSDSPSGLRVLAETVHATILSAMATQTAQAGEKASAQLAGLRDIAELVDTCDGHLVHVSLTPVKFLAKLAHEWMDEQRESWK